MKINTITLLTKIVPSYLKSTVTLITAVMGVDSLNMKIFIYQPGGGVAHL